MSIKVLDFSDQFLHALSICAMVCEVGKKKTLKPRSDVHIQSSYPIVGGVAWIGLVIEHSDNEHCHFHIDTAREELFDCSGELFKTVDLEALLEKANSLLKHRVDAFVTARFRVPFSQIPRRGIVGSLSGTATEACGYKMRLTGASMDIGGDPYTHLKWQLASGDDVDDLFLDVKLDADTGADVTNDYIIEIAEIMRDGLDCLVFESQPDKSSHGANRIAEKPVSKSSAAK